MVKTEKFKNKVEKLVGSKFVVLGEYINTDTKIEMKHIECGHVFTPTPKNFIKGSRCPLCSGKMKKTTGQFAKEVEKLTDGRYVLIGEYAGNRVNVEVLHTEYGNTFDVKPNNFLSNNSRCPHCSKYKPLTREDFRKRVEESTDGEYALIGNFVNTGVKVKLRHELCGKTYMASPGDFREGCRCPHCFGTPRKTTEIFAREITRLTDGGYQLIGGYEKK